MTWNETNSGNLRSELGQVEKVYRNISTLFLPLNKEHWVIHCICTLQALPGNIVDSLRNAWKTLRFEYPDIGVIPDGVAYKTYSTVDGLDLQNWLDETFFVQHEGTAKDIIEAAKPNSFPSLYYFPTSREVLFLSAHWRIDGVGTLNVLDRLFSMVANDVVDPAATLPWGTEHGGLSPCLEDAIGASSEYSDEMRTYARDAIADFHKNAVQKTSFPFKGDMKTPPASSLNETVQFTATSTSAIIQACKSRQISVTAAVHTALAEVYFEYTGPEDTESDYTTATSVNMRKYLPSPYNSSSHPFQPYVTSITPTVSRHSSFAERTAALMADYTDWYNEDFRKCLRLIYQYHADALSMPPAPGSPPRPPPSGLSLSSLGLVEKLLRADFADNLRLDRIHFGVSMLTRQILLYVWTFNNQLTLSVNYNDAYYDQATIYDVLRRMVKALEQGLGLTLETHHIG
jgi:15-O-acetyltransferase Tri3